MKPENLLYILRTAPHHYALLGVHAGFTPEELSAARRALASALHPDRHPENAQEMAAVNAAHAALEDPTAHARYRAELRSGHTVCVECAGLGYRKSQRGFKVQVRTGCLPCLGSGYVLKVRKHGRP